MRLLRLAEVQKSSRDRVFRYSPARALLLVFTVICVCAVLLLVNWRGRSILAYYVAGVLLLGFLFMRRFILARFRPSNWLVRMSVDALFIQFRSYLNYHLPAEDLTVVFIPYDEIGSARLVRERSKVRSYSGGVSERSRRLVEFELAGDPAMLAKVLADEVKRRAPQERRWYGTSATLYEHYPMRMVSPTAAQLEWTVVPRAGVFLDALRSYTTILPPVKLSEDFVHLQGLSREDQEKRLRELVERGQTIAAIYIARRLYSYDLNQAKAFIDGLRGGNARSTSA